MRRTNSEIFRVFLRLGLTSFGGPVAHLGYFREEFVRRRSWLDENQYAGVIAISQFLPGPGSSQVGFALGLLRGGFPGAFLAWLAFTLPSALLMVGFAATASRFEHPIALGVIAGLKAVAVGIVAHAVFGMARQLTPDTRRAFIAAIAAAVTLLVPGALTQVGVILIGIAAGILLTRNVSSATSAPLHFPVTRRAGIAALVTCAALFGLLPLLTVFIEHPTLSLADAMYRVGALVFGGGHVVLPLLQAEPFMSQTVTEDVFLAGYGAAQAVPGPLFTFAAYLGAVSGEGAMSLVHAGVALIAIFLPGMLLLIGVLPFWNRAAGNPILQAGLRGANAAVVGILAAALWDPVIVSGAATPQTLTIALICGALLFWRVLPVWLVVVTGAALGALLAALLH